jgi:hypothetical protein
MAMCDIGEEGQTFVIEPLVEPVPVRDRPEPREPAPDREPIEPERTPVPA